jgi:hypothetical protein
MVTKTLCWMCPGCTLLVALALPLSACGLDIVAKDDPKTSESAPASFAS